MRICYEAGGYIQIEIPDCEINYADMDITAHPDEHDEAEKFKLEWDKFGLWSLKMKNDEEVVRAYSMASYPAEGRRYVKRSVLHRLGTEQKILGLTLILV